MKAILGLVSIAILLGGCSGHLTPPAAVPMGQRDAVTTVGVTHDGFTTNGSDIESNAAMTATPIPAGVRLTGEQPITDHRYGFVLGYFKGLTSTTSQVITVAAGKKITFKNVDTGPPHTVSFLGNATATSAPWPSSFNGSFTKSPAGTPIGKPMFSTGALNPGQKSAVYSTGMPGFYMEGCGFHYDSSKMRTVIIVK